MNYTTYMIVKPIRIPLWELQRGELNPSLNILRNWVRFTGQDASKGGGGRLAGPGADTRTRSPGTSWGRSSLGRQRSGTAASGR